MENNEGNFELAAKTWREIKFLYGDIVVVWMFFFYGDIVVVWVDSTFTRACHRQHFE
jgi:hypothetical protein